MLLKLTVHAKVRLSERGIQIEEVKSAIKHPDSEIQIEDGRTKVLKYFGGKKFIVVYYKTIKEEYLIITAYY